MTDMKINHTRIGREFMWDRLSDVDLDQLENTRAARMQIINDPDRFPLGDLAAAKELVMAIDLFMFDYGDLLAEFA